MKTYVKLPCPNCHQILPIRTEYFGKRVACKQCKHAFIPEPKDALPPAPPQPDPRLTAAQQRISELEANLQRTRVETAKRGTDHAQALQERDSARAEVARLAEQLQPLRTEVARLEEQLQTLRQAADEAAEQNRTDHAQALQERDSGRAEAVRLEEQLQALRRQVADENYADALASSCEMQQMLALQQEFYEAGEQHRRQGEEWENELADTRAEAEWLHAVVGDLRDGEGQAAATEAELRTQLAASEVACQQFQDQALAAESRVQELDAIRVERDAVRTELDAIRAERDELLRWQEEISSLTEQFEATITELEQAQAQKATVHAQFVCAQEDERARWQAERRERIEQVEDDQRLQAEAAAERLRAERDKYEQVCDQNTRQLADVEAARAEAEQHYQREREHWTEALEQSRHEQTGNSETHEEGVEQLRALQAERAALAADHAAALQDAKRAREQLTRSEEEVQVLKRVGETRQQALATTYADAEDLRRLVADLQARLGEDEAAKKRLQGEAILLRDELIGTKASYRRLIAQIDALRAERVQLLERAQQTPTEPSKSHEWDDPVMQKALEGVSTNVGWPWFDFAKREEQALQVENASAWEQRLQALQNEATRLRNENALLRQQLRNFGVEMMDR